MSNLDWKHLLPLKRWKPLTYKPSFTLNLEILGKTKEILFKCNVEQKAGLHKTKQILEFNSILKAVFINKS